MVFISTPEMPEVEAARRIAFGWWEEALIGHIKGGSFELSLVFYLRKLLTYAHLLRLALRKNTREFIYIFRLDGHQVPRMCIYMDTRSSKEWSILEIDFLPLLTIVASISVIRFVITCLTPFAPATANP